MSSLAALDLLNNKVNQGIELGIRKARGRDKWSWRNNKAWHKDRTEPQRGTPMAPLFKRDVSAKSDSRPAMPGASNKAALATEAERALATEAERPLLPGWKSDKFKSFEGEEALKKMEHYQSLGKFRQTLSHMNNASARVKLAALAVALAGAAALHWTLLAPRDPDEEEPKVHQNGDSGARSKKTPDSRRKTRRQDALQPLVKALRASTAR